ncbi:MAG: endo-1,4-beta-xylanase [Bacteroidales bacterium]|nr:endo-1,4-beta-xylanase [Bacteroidales bacterium]MCF8389861.1 endo-1,4-beta-xylanase [Bacteroidales bacterium]
MNNTIFSRHFRLIIIPSLLTSLISCNNSSLSEPVLKDTFKNNFMLGVAINSDVINGTDSSSLNLVSKQFNQITAENAMKPMFIQPKEGEFHFEMADKLVEFGEKNSMFIVGHTLIWHSQTPDWFFEDEEGNEVTRDILLKRMESHISTYVGRYKGKVKGWDVVNEAVSDEGGLRKTKWYTIIGEDYIQKAFEFAYEADPDAELYYNDYSLDKAQKRNDVVALIKNLQDKGVKISAVGMQGHYDLEEPAIEEVEKSILAFSELGVKVMITELDVSALPVPENFRSAEVSVSIEMKEKLNPYTQGLPDSVQNTLAERYEDLFRLFVKHSDKITRVTFWGVNDKVSWKNNFPVRGRTDYPLLFDRENNPKKAFYEVNSIVQD